MGQNTKTVTDQSFQADVLGADKPVLVDFWAEWCGPCRMIAPALEEIAAELGEQVTDRQDQHRRKSGYAGPIWRARHSDHVAVQEWRGRGPEGRRRSAQPDPAVAGGPALRPIETAPIQLTSGWVPPYIAPPHRPRAGDPFSCPRAAGFLRNISSHARHPGQKHLRFGQRPLRRQARQDRRNDQQLSSRPSRR